jgi:WD40 repeat protein
VIATGSCDEEINNVSVWHIGTEGEESSALDPVVVSSKVVAGDVTDLRWATLQHQDLLVCSSSTGEVSFFKSEGSALEECGRWGVFGSGVSCFDLELERQQMAVGGENGELSLFSVNLAGPPKATRQHAYETELSVSAVRFLSSFVVAAAHGKVRFWDTRAGQSPFSSLSTQANSEIHSLSPHPVQSQFIVATGASDGSVAIWDTRNTKGPIMDSRSHSSDVWKVEFHRTIPSCLLSCGEDGAILLWDMGIEQQLSHGVFTPSHANVSSLHSTTSGVNCFDVSTSQNSLIATADNQAIILRTGLV